MVKLYVLALSVAGPVITALYLWKTRKLLRRQSELEAEVAAAKREAQEAATRADESKAAKTKFLSSMSHQIRTPMSGIIGMTDLLSRTPLTAEQREYADTIGSSGRVLLNIIDDILDLARAHDGYVRMECAPFDLRRTLEDAIALAAPSADQRNLDLAMRYGAEVPRGFSGDANRIRQVTLNLLGNAVKFTNQGYVLLDVTAEGEAGEDCTVRVTVEDTGIGIDAAEQSRLFLEFERLSSAAKLPGAGLGLVVSKKLLELMGGSIGFESTLGAGSKFWFTVPLKTAPEAARAVPPQVREARARVLVAAPRTVGRKVLSENLAQLGMRVDHVEAPEDVLSAMRLADDAGERFAIAVLDLPGLGIHAHNLTTGIRRDSRIRNTGMILLSSPSGGAEAERLAQVVKAVHLSKPVRPSQFEDALAVALAGPAPAAETAAPPLTLVGLDPARWSWNVLVVEDNAVNQRVAVAQLNSLGCRVEVAANGREAVERLRASSYDLVFMDCLMPEMDGYEATRQIRRMEGDKAHTIIVAMTARAYLEDRQRCREAGMDDYLAKPVLAEDMQRVLERWKRPPGEANQ